MSNDWLRVYSKLVDDKKLGLLEFRDRWHFVALLCCKDQGILEEKNTNLLFRKVAVKLEITVNELRLLAARLSSIGLINKQSLEPSMEFVAKTANDLRPSAKVWIRIRSRIFQRDNYTCNYCGERGGRLECDHFIPVSRGGSNDDTNLVTACFSCNRSKRDKLVSEWRKH